MDVLLANSASAASTTSAVYLPGWLNAINGGNDLFCRLALATSWFTMPSPSVCTPPP
jgi:hypothetical protein